MSGIGLDVEVGEAEHEFYAQQVENTAPFVTVYQCIAGWKAVLMSWDMECDGYTPWNTSYFAYPDRKGAERYAKDWAESEEIEFKA